MSRLKKLKIEEEQGMLQKTVRIPADIARDFELLMVEAKIDSFNKAVLELIKMEIDEWKEEKKREEKATKKESKNTKIKSRKQSTKDESKKESQVESKVESKKE